MYFSRGKNKIQGAVKSSELCKAYNSNAEDNYKVTGQVFRDVMEDYYILVGNRILEGDVYKLPAGFGTLFIRQRKVKNSYPIDWKNTAECGKLVFNFNEHSNGMKAHFLWAINKTRVIYANLYRFKPCRRISRNLAKKINNERYTYFEKH